MSRWKKVIRGLEDSFAASAFAEAGEFDTAKKIIDNSKGWVVLAGQGDGISKKICSYVRRLCENTKSTLQIIWKGSISPSELRKKLNGINFRLVWVSDDLEEAIPFCLRKLRRVSMVVLTGEKKKYRTFLNRISYEFMCPLVVISEKDIKEG